MHSRDDLAIRPVTLKTIELVSTARFQPRVHDDPVIRNTQSAYFANQVLRDLLVVIRTCAACDNEPVGLNPEPQIADSLAEPAAKHLLDRCHIQASFE